MEQKRFLLFMVSAVAILMAWQTFFLPRVAPKPAPADQVAQNDDKQPGDAAALKADTADAADAVAEDKAAPEEKKSPQEAELPQHKRQRVKLGSIEPEKTGYRMYVTLTSLGGAIEEIRLNDPRYRELHPPHDPLPLIQPGAGPELTLQTAVPEFGYDVNKHDWEVVPNSESKSEATFRIRSADGMLEALKRYELKKVDPQQPENESPAYELLVDLTFKNLGKKPRTVHYEIQGPVGLPLENVDNTSKFRDVVVAFLDADGAVRPESITGKEISKAKQPQEEWTKPLKYIGVDVQYFAALLLPSGDQLKASYVKSSQPELIGPAKDEKSEVSVELKSVDLELPAVGLQKSVTHSYRLFAGPKRDDLLDPIGAGKVVDYGMFAWISRPMLAVLEFFHTLFHSYGIAIICLTVLVRGAMFPLSIKQARSAAKMQELQPEIAAIKEKYAKDKEELGGAQMELFSKHNYNPFGGCLLMFFQLPVFMGLYQALSHAVDLRLAKFLWMDNLAGPDALFQLPFALPFIGRDFNLLPMITIVLFIVQQKMFMPPAMNEEQAMQQKMMNFMMVFMGFMFYKVPAGLCVYFIASSMWGMAERKLLPKAKPGAVSPPPPPRSDSGPGPSRPDSGNNEPNGLLAKLLKAAEKETTAKKASSGRRK